ncbi:unnamed protein product [Urochloa humidicola]
MECSTGTGHGHHWLKLPQSKCPSEEKERVRTSGAHGALALLGKLSCRSEGLLKNYAQVVACSVKLWS